MSYDPFNWVVLVTLAIGTITAIVALILIVSRLARKKDQSTSICIESPEGVKYKIESGNLSPEEIEKLLKAVRTQKSSPPNDKESGAVLSDVLFGIVPAAIALSFVATIIFLVIQEKQVPGVLVNSLTTIIGYYFGIGASGAFSSEKKLTAEEVRQLLDGQ